MRFLVVDSQPIILSGIKSLLTKEFPNAICDTLSCADLFVERVEKDYYSIIVTELNMPSENMMALIELALIKRSSLRILVYTSFPDYLFSKRLLQLGAKGFVNKSQTAEDLLLALRTVLNGEYYWGNQVVGKKLLDYSFSQYTNPFVRLTHREMEICLLIIKGYRLREMADMMNLQKSTIGTHQSRILGKLGLQKPFEIRELAAAYSIPIYE